MVILMWDPMYHILTLILLYLLFVSYKGLMTDWFNLKHVAKPFERENKMCCNWRFILFRLFGTLACCICLMSTINVWHRSMKALWIRYVMRAVKVQDLRSVEKWILRLWPCGIWHQCVGRSIHTNISVSSHEDGGSRFLQNIDNHLHVSPPEDCTVIVNKDYSLVECGNVWLLRWILDYMHQNTGSHLRAGLHSVTSQKTVMWES